MAGKCQCGCDQRTDEAIAARKAAVVKFEALSIAARVGGLRNQVVPADPNWTLPKPRRW